LLDRYKAGAEDFLTKPVSSDDLLRAIKRASAHHEVTRGHAADLAEDTAFASPKFVATAASRTSGLKRLVYIWIAAAVVLLVSIGETAAQPKSGELPLSRKKSCSFIRMARISSRGPHGARKSRKNWSNSRVGR
jgi:hypothetical protein